MIRKHALPITAVLCAVSVIVMIAVLMYSEKSEEFSPPPFDTEAKEGMPEAPENSGYEEIDAKAFKFSAAGDLTVRDGMIDVWLTNSEENDVWMKVRVIDESGDMLGQSGLIRPGEYVKSVKLDRIPEETAAVTLKIMAYEPETYYSAGSVTLNTELKIK